MRRRDGLVGLAACAAWPLAQAQPTAPRLVGVLAPSTAAREAVTLQPFFDQMRRLGWVEGRNVLFERAYADDQYPRLEQLARELVARRPDLIFAPPLPAAVAARAATATIPIVFATGTDPVGAGLVKSLAHPGGNATGMISVVDSLAPKWLELLLELMPAVRRLGLLGHTNDTRLALDREALAPLLAERGIRLQVAVASSPQVFDGAVAQLLQQRVEVIVTHSSLSFNLRDRLFELLRGKRVAVVGHRAELAEAGALFSYGASLQGQIRRAAFVVDQILRGAKPADIPVQQPVEFDLVLNLKTARQLNVAVPRTMLLRANQVIE